MKNYRKIAAVLSVCVLALAGCGNRETVETTADTAAAEFTEATEEHTSAETAAEEETETVTSEETTVTETTTVETAAETEASNPYYNNVNEFSDTDAENFSGKFYECTFDSFVVAQNEESFIAKGGTREMIEAARQAVLEGDEFKDAAAEIKADTNGIYERILSNEHLTDENKNITAAFAEGFSGDFDGNGSTEAFLRFLSVGSTLDASVYPKSIGSYAVFVNSDGKAEVVRYGVGMSIYALRYNGFTHLCTDYGSNIMSSGSEIYAVENETLVQKHRNFRLGSVSHGFMLIESAAQAPGPWYVFWNNDTKTYDSVANAGWDYNGVNLYDVDLDYAAANTIPHDLEELSDDEILKTISDMSGDRLSSYDIKHSNMFENAGIDPSGEDIVFAPDNFTVELLKDDYDGDGKDEIFAKTAFPVYAEDSPNAGKLSTVFLRSVNGRDITLIDWSGYRLCENNIFTVQVGQNKLLCIVYKFDAEKKYQNVSCYTFFDGKPRKLDLYTAGHNIVTDMTNLYLQKYGEEDIVKAVSKISVNRDSAYDNVYLE